MKTTVCEYGGLVEGDLVRIKGERGQFRFLSHTTNEDSGAEWVSVYGPVLHHYRQFRAFHPDRIQPTKGN